MVAAGHQDGVSRASGWCQQGIRTQSCCLKVTANHNPRSESLRHQSKFEFIKNCFDLVCACMHSDLDYADAVLMPTVSAGHLESRLIMSHFFICHNHHTPTTYLP